MNTKETARAAMRRQKDTFGGGRRMMGIIVPKASSERYQNREVQENNTKTMFDPQLSPEHIVDRFHHTGKAEMMAYPQSTDMGFDNESRREPILPSPPVAPAGPAQRSGRWTPDEKLLFLYGLKRFGKGRWKKMSVYLPHRSLVQIKSHAQKVLKRMEAGEDVFKRLDESYQIIDSLVVQAARQHDALAHMAATTPKSTVAKRKKTYNPMYSYEDGTDPQQQLQQQQQFPVDSDVAALAASALCQLSSLPS